MVTSLARSQSIIDCKFEDDLCGWTAELPWTISDKTFIPSPLNFSPMTLIGDGEFITAQGHFGSNSSADLISPELDPSDAHSILSFKYTKTLGDANLQIMLKEGDNYRNLDQISTNILAFWIRRSLVVPRTDQPYQIVFRVSKLRTGFDYISIDDIMLTNTSPKSILSADEEIRPHLIPMSKNVGPRELRRSPSTLKPLDLTHRPPTQCALVKCSFRTSACAWTYDRWKLLNGKIVNEGQGDAVLSSEPVLLPMNAHFELDVLASELSAVSVYQVFGSEENLIWTQRGIIIAGWNRIRLPLRFSPMPSRLVIKTSTARGQFVAITNTNIVDESGRDLACGGNMHVIRPKYDNLIRLTAIQRIDPGDSETSTKKPILRVLSTTTRPPARVRPISSHVVRSMQNSFSISAPAQSEPSPFAVMPISPSEVSSNQQIDPPRTTRPTPVSPSAFMPIKKTNITLPIMGPEPTFPTPVVAETKRTPSIQDLITGIAGQPIFEGQLKYLAKKFGFDRMTGEQAAQRLMQIQQVLGSLRPPPTSNRKPISPVNAKEENTIPPDLISKLASILPSSSTINGALTNKITQFIAPPQSHGDDSKPFSRDNMDFVIQNAYNAYMNQARP
ncbi:unnamed protein product [Cylicocyclus nassatus]|uniref:MAM domain-containing protein n=1 Tax=Cylicocyclus nassatus TaxID=53992 RepID=A0AA36M3G8_CYLNA|nr:unnamed protein product [Cylicocyclus nassatus]